MDVITNDRLNFMLQSPFGIAFYTMITDKDGHLTDLIIDEVNDAFMNIAGIQEQSPVGKSVKELFKSGYIQKLYTDIFASNGSWEYELYRPQNGNWYSVKTSKQNGKLMTVFVDVTLYKSQSEELETFFDLNLDMFSIADMSGHFLKLNKAWESTLGYTLQELELTNFLELIHPDDLEATELALKKLGNNTTISNFTNRYRSKKGDYRYIEWRSMPSGGLIYSSCRDVTNLISQAEQIEKQEIFRQVIDNVGGVFWLLSADWREMLYISPNEEELFGQKIPPDIDLVNLINQFVHPDDRSLVEEKFRELISVGNFQMEVRLLRPDNQEIWVSSSGFNVYDEQGRVIRHAGLIQDITKRKQAELSDLDKTNRLHAMLQAMPDVLITYNSKGEYLDLSATDKSKRIFKDQDVNYRHISDFFGPEITKSFMEAIRRCLETQSTHTITFDYEQEERVRHFENRFIPIDTEKVLSVVRDVSESSM